MQIRRCHFFPQKAFSPWWEDLEDKLLYSLMIFGKKNKNIFFLRSFVVTLSTSFLNCLSFSFPLCFNLLSPFYHFLPLCYLSIFNFSLILCLSFILVCFCCFLFVSHPRKSQQKQASAKLFFLFCLPKCMQ